MTVSFTSTYRVPFKQPGKGIKPGRKDDLKAIANQYGGLVPSSREGNVKFSVRKKFDEQIEAQLKRLGFTTYDKVEIHNVPKEQILDALDYRGRFTKLNPKLIEIKAIADSMGNITDAEMEQYYKNLDRIAGQYK